LERGGEEEVERVVGEDGVRSFLLLSPTSLLTLSAGSLSLQESSETYAHMASDLKTSLFPMLQEQKDAYMLWDLTYPSFVRKSGWRVDLSAGDCVEALGAMLEAATGVRLDFTGAIDGRRALMGTETNGGQGAGHHDAATQHGGREEWSQGIKGWVSKGEGEKENLRPVGQAGEDEGMSEKEVREKRDRDESEARRRNFWYAWDALDPEECVAFSPFLSCFRPRLTSF
jgi:cell division control protein 45